MKLSGFTSLAALLLLAMFGRTAFATVRLPHLLSDHAVLQRERPMHLWGWATAGSHLHILFHRQQMEVVANDGGQWSLYLEPERAGGPFILTIRGDGPEVVVNDLLVGDVWIASGQSNMEFPLQGFPGAPMKNQQAEITASTQPQLRLLRLSHKGSQLPLVDQPNGWTLCNPITAREFSAVAYFFGRDISEHQHVPVGLIDTSWGGTPADTWISAHAYGEDPRLLPALHSFADFNDDETDLDAIAVSERNDDAVAAAEGRPKPKHTWHPPVEAFAPSSLFNGMISPLTPYAVKGFIWYQGETNSAHDRVAFYSDTLGGLIADWRERFGQGMLPFLYAQISSFESPNEEWGRLRDQQRRVLGIAGTAMAVTLDLGEADNVHPPDKQTVAARLAAAGRHLVYGEDIPFSGPLFREATTDCLASTPCGMRVWFDHAEGLSSHSAALTSFEVAGADHHFVPATATIDGSSVRVAAESVKKPVYVRFGWSSVVTSSLYNAAGFPASTFTSELKVRVSE